MDEREAAGVERAIKWLLERSRGMQRIRPVAASELRAAAVLLSDDLEVWRSHFENEGRVPPPETTSTVK